MVRAILLISLLVGAVSAGVVGPGAPCGGRENESFQLSKACEATCAHPVQECLGECVCNEGFVRNAQDQCVPATNCPANPCATKVCPRGEVCVLVDIFCVQGPCDSPIAECHPISTGQDCSTMLCNTPAGCAMVQPATCTTPTCPKVPMCIDSNPCWHTRCSLGYECVLQETACGSPPCAPHATCQLQGVDIPLQI
ncbi:hypothetical protein CAEBREN_03381 [Caenorhabditis brenneri]|uniref:TIL domain-containing protein n=1 Tax=Caenorhabditis brenneri TaxID=135651 RepID=G0PDH9_CAEBE|nr:hypothetical protein CAEBREN_03381 [Caenorhabditis brenneri]